MPEQEKRFSYQHNDDNNVNRVRLRKYKLWIRVLEWIVDQKGGKGNLQPVFEAHRGMQEAH